MKVITCKKCDATIEIDGPGRHTCPGCGVVYNVSESNTRLKPTPPPPAETAPGAEDIQLAPVADAAPATQAPQRPTGTAGRVARIGTKSHPRVTSSRPHSPVVEGAMLAGGGVSLLLGLIIFAVGPFDGSIVAQRRARIRALEGDLAAVQDELADFEKERVEIQARTAELTETYKENQREVVELEKKKRQLAELDTKLKVASESLVMEQLGATAMPTAGGATTVAGAEKSTVVIRTDIGSGSGFIVDAEGLVITNYHVIEASSKLDINMQKRESTEQVKIEGAKVIAVDADHDLAIIKLPPAPESVARGAGYQALRLRTTPEVSAGETVFAIGNPGAGGEILDYTLTKGIVSNPKRRGKDMDLIQTTAPINPGNSGGPLIDTDGNVVGVVALKGVNVEAVAFAIPSSAVKTLIAKQKEAPHAVKGTLEEWEKENRPLTALARRRPSYKEDCAVKVDRGVDTMLLSRDGDKIYLLMGEVGQVCEFDIASRAVGRSFKADTEVRTISIDKLGNTLYVVASEKSSIMRVNVATMDLKDETVFDNEPLDVVNVGGVSGDTAIMLDRQAPVLLRPFDFGRTGDRVEMPNEVYSAICASNGAWLCMARRAPLTAAGTSPYELIAYGAPELKSFYSLANLRETAKKRGFPPNIVKRIRETEEKVDGARSVYAISSKIAEEEGGLAPAILFVGPHQVIFGRRIIRLAGTMKVDGVLEPGPYSTDDRPGMKRRRDFYKYMDNVFSTSPDGKWAATGTHIYSVKTRKPIRQLPFPSSVHVFSKDGTSLYIFDPLRTKVYLLEDWEQAADRL